MQEAIRNAEQSGDMGGPLVHMADFLDEENEIVVKALTSLLEPMILIILGPLILPLSTRRQLASSARLVLL